jgi:hypothetical protein
VSVSSLTREQRREVATPVRLGQRVEDPALADAAVEYAQSKRRMAARGLRHDRLRKWVASIFGILALVVAVGMAVVDATQVTYPLLFAALCAGSLLTSRYWHRVERQAAIAEALNRELTGRA